MVCTEESDAEVHTSPQELPTLTGGAFHIAPLNKHIFAEHPSILSSDA